MSAKSPLVSVIICAKNEEQSIGEVICSVMPHAGEVLVVDGHSYDRTREVARDLGACVVLDRGKGKGDAIRTGIAKARGDIIVFIDADGSHEPSDIPRLVAPILDGEADIVIGSRGRGGSDEAWGTIENFIRTPGGHLLTLALNYRFGVSLTESLNGFRAISASVVRALDLREDTITIEQEMLTKCLKMGYRVT
ncbi:MAG: glycosyltransferase family 2 protein, partial [Patescibacteria group bacterium]|nr:glycosyltransferase family 2 protein [Patescibacteria group bacterium]